MPFLLLHGDGLWKVLLVAFVAIVIAGTHLRRKLGARNRAKLATRMLDRDASEGVVRGTLGGGSIATLVFVTTPPSDETTLRHRDPELWIETPEGRVRLVGDIQALSGSRTSATRNGVPKRTPFRDNPLVHPPLSDRTHRFRRGRGISLATLVELAPGDQVIARGALVREAGTEATDYRENATAVSLEATDTPIQIVAQQPRSAVARPSVFAFALLVGVSGFLGYKVEAALGSSWRATCLQDVPLSEDGPSHIVLDNTQRCVLANTMPDQDDALERLSDRFDRTPVTNEAELEQHLELARLSGGCTSSLDHARRFGPPETLLAEAERCHNFGQQQLALIELGRFEEAARLGMISRNPGPLFVLGGNWSAAADLAASNANQVKRDPDMTEARFDSLVLQWRCLAELMRWDAGDRAALDRVRALSPGPNPPCRVELVEMTTGADRDALLLDGASEDAMRAAFQPLGIDELRTFSLQQALAGQPALMEDSIGSTLADGSAQMSMLWSPMVWTAAIAPEPRDGASANFMSAAQGKVAYYQGRVVAHVYDGDLAAAHADADRTKAIADSFEHDIYIYSRRDLSVLHALIDLYSAVTTTPFSDASVEKTTDNQLLGYLLPHIYLRHGIKKLDNHWLHTDFKALLAASDGDGGPLVTEMIQPFHSWTNMDVLAVLPRIKTHRDEVMQIVKWGPTDGPRVPYDFPWGLIANTAERRTMFELVGDHDEAARWAAIYARYRKAFTDRKTLIALALWGRT
jgi:hypothetical protein